MSNNVVTVDKFDDSATNMYARCGNHYLIHVPEGGHDFTVLHSPVNEDADVPHSEPDMLCVGGPELSKHAVLGKKAASGPAIIKVVESENEDATAECTCEVVKHALSENSHSLF